MGFRPRDRVPGFDFTEPVGQIPRVFRIRRGPFAAYDKRGATGAGGRVAGSGRTMNAATPRRAHASQRYRPAPATSCRA